jgi:glutathione S-transferase
MLERSPKGKVPWITLNGVVVSDSQFCIEYLTKKYGKDLSDNLNTIEKAISRALLKLCEESFRLDRFLFIIL